MQHFHARVHRVPARAGGANALRGLSRGFSLVELMVAVSIVAILLAMGVPAMQGFMTGRAVISQAEELVATLRLARSDALRLNSAVTVCAADTTAASPTCAASVASATWNTGWLTFIDMNNDGELDSGEGVLRVQSPLKSVKAITSDTKGRVRFFPNGLPATGAAAFEVQPKLPGSDNRYDAMLRRVQVNTTGRALILAGSGSA